MVNTQLARARNLRVHFYGCEKSDAEPQIAIFQSLSARSSSLEELSIGLTSNLFPFLSTLRDRVPSLRRLWIQWNDSDSQTAVHTIEAFHTAPSLIDAGIYNEYGPVPILFPTHQLTRYQLDGSWSTHEVNLKTAQNLVDARIEIAFDIEPWQQHGDIITLPCLRRLYVSHTGVLRYLRTPALQDIGFFRREDDHDLLLRLDPLLVRSTCHLRRFCFRGSPDLRGVSEILQKYPSITELAIMICYPDTGGDVVLAALCEAASTLISHLTVPNPTGSAAVFPQLSAIDFGCWNPGGEQIIVHSHPPHCSLIQAQARIRRLLVDYFRFAKMG
ncbi:hypothetical protein B0H17DRAFT_1200775 [Mycena rosella]|uniref:F-box domain-containing protein n=1 Tax=Mycena rosella TaxID=1033263 RepID=A0AAD7DIB1_MYCRO|nr:hypothetical protein B0H17DRAFT_1200775 [Mycena rosella]